MGKQKSFLGTRQSIFIEYWSLASFGEGSGQRQSWKDTPVSESIAEKLDLWLENHESVSRSVVSDTLGPHGPHPARLLCPWNSPGKNTRVGCHSLLQGIFLTQGLNPGLLHCRQILYYLSHQRSLGNHGYFFFFFSFFNQLSTRSKLCFKKITLAVGRTHWEDRVTGHPRFPAH